jgi:hypothetical protein
MIIRKERPMTHPKLPRRDIIRGTGLALFAGAVGATALSQGAVAAENASDIWSGEYWARKGDVPLWMFRKRLGAPKAGEPARPVVFFVHGSSVTSRAFDLTVPGKDEYSVMNEFARYGFDSWTMDHENYGKSGRTSGIAAVPDLVEFFEKLPNGDRQFIILPGTAHSVVLAINRQLFWHVTRSFLTMPTPIAT